MGMDKREFLKMSGVVMAGGLVSKMAGAAALTGDMDAPGDGAKPMVSAPAGNTAAMAGARTNWAGNLTYGTNQLATAQDVEEVKKALAAHPHAKALGARHSFNTIADSNEQQISLKPFDHMELNAEAHTVKVGAGVTYGQLAPFLDSRGFAVHNMASLPHISVVGACATATHGSGNRNGNLSTAVRAFEMVKADGSVVRCSKADLGDAWPGMVVGLGALGVITNITLEVVPRFEMTQLVYENLSFAQLEHNLEAIFSSGYSVSLFTDWQKGRATQVWLKQTVQPGADPGVAIKIPPEFYGATAAKRKMHPIGDHPAEACTEQMGMPGPWFERLPHFKMNFTPSSGAEIQTEYFVPRKHGYAAIRAVEELRDQITPHLFVTEFRTIAADDLWMSPCYQRDAMTLHFTWKPEWASIQPILPQIESRLAPFGVRPHWAKMFTIAPAKIRAQYPRMDEYKQLVAKYDPQGKFRNAFLNLNLYS